MEKSFGTLPTGEQATLYTITGGGITATITDYGATLVSLFVPDARGDVADVTLGYDDVNGYAAGTCFLGAVVGRSANRIGGSAFDLNGRTVTLEPNEGRNNLHSGPSFFHNRFWKLVTHSENAITFSLKSPPWDQGFPGEAEIRVTYALESGSTLCITYDAVSSEDTVFNLTQHAYFNLAGQDKPEKAMDQVLMLPARTFTVADEESIPTGEQRSVEASPMDFRTPKPIGQDIGADYDALNLQGGYDHNFEVFCNPCAVLTDPESGRTMAISTDCPGIQFYAGNFLKEPGKGGVYYGKRSGVALETQFYPDALHHPDWQQPITKAGQRYHSQTRYKFG